MHRNKSPIRRYCSAPLAFIRFSPSSRFFHNSTLEHILCSNERWMEITINSYLHYHSAQHKLILHTPHCCSVWMAGLCLVEAKAKREEQSKAFPPQQTKTNSLWISALGELFSSFSACTSRVRRAEWWNRKKMSYMDVFLKVLRRSTIFIPLLIQH